ncbi:hypothetical protein MNBD_GAMMA23-15 [hydrothermal vent metagenome]|uniref:Uncharacterized protein n=1 Tax=hydrothermal vent metagenome TaxID=652676 RepID=A0A3B1ADX8_9ZZZZ
MRLSKITVIAMAGLFSTAFISAQAQADCNIELPYDKLSDCIVEEGAGAQYNVVEDQDYYHVGAKTNEQKQPKKEISNDLAAIK